MVQFISLEYQRSALESCLKTGMKMISTKYSNESSELCVTGGVLNGSAVCRPWQGLSSAAGITALENPLNKNPAVWISGSVSNREDNHSGVIQKNNGKTNKQNPT